MDGDDLSVYDAADELQQQADRDVDTLNELQRELSSHSLVGLYTSHFTVTPTPTADWSVVITVFVCLSMSISPELSVFTKFLHIYSLSHYRHFSLTVSYVGY